MSNGYCDAWDYLAHDEAEKLAAKKLSRCKRYFLRKGDVHELSQFTNPCMFCWNEMLEHFRGIGCKMCAGTGLVLVLYKLPVNFELYYRDSPF